LAKGLVIVESPAKAKTIQKYLGKGFTVEASLGHVKDLPKSTLGVDVENDFETEYVVIPGKEKVVARLKKLALGMDNIYLAPDPDREGEAIAAHLAEELGEGHFPGLVAQAQLPTPDEFAHSPVAEARETYLDQVEDDLRAVIRASEGRGESTPSDLIFYVADPWKAVLESWLREAVERKEMPTVRDIMARVKDHPDLSAHRAEVPKYVERVGPLLRSEPSHEASQGVPEPSQDQGE